MHRNHLRVVYSAYYPTTPDVSPRPRVSQRAAAACDLSPPATAQNANHQFNAFAVVWRTSSELVARLQCILHPFIHPPPSFHVRLGPAYPTGPSPSQSAVQYGTSTFGVSNLVTIWYSSRSSAPLPYKASGKIPKLSTHSRRPSACAHGSGISCQ
ncbi:hypothetical protein K438DRAFT_1890027 [Mycena galopus ATCC 62051]|nr:hypothetical protein K438DRAFT_1890027 [Mycena galopus ATCC 62051]